MKRRTSAVGRALGLGAVATLALACGATTVNLACRDSRDCLDSELCHPDTLLCVERCTTKADCPGKEDEKVCVALSDSNSTRICKCLVDKCLPTSN